jgi:transcriptional regulator with XRE-family HTH domain
VFFDLLDSICKENGTTVTAVLVAVGLSKGSIRNWKNGVLPKYQTRLKIANYLGVPVERLMTEQEIEEEKKQHEQIEKLVEDVARKVSSPLPKTNFDELSYAAYQEMEGESEDFKNDILSYIKFKKSQKGND